MMKSFLWVGLGLTSMSSLALAADNPPSVQQQLDQLKQQYETRLQALETQLQSQKPVSAPVAASGFNPSVSLILAGTYTNLSRNPELYQIQGFIPAGDEVGPGSRSFNLGESELNLSATIDPNFSGSLTLALAADNSLEVEEAKVDSLGWSHGINLRFGRFLSSLGYLNNQHSHTWDFVDAPLAYQALFGGQLKQDGVQFSWLAPTDSLVELGLELGRGAEFPGSDSQTNGLGSSTLFARWGDDIGTSASWHSSLWAQHHRIRDRSLEMDSAVANTAASFSGKADTWGLSAVYKWSPEGNSSERNFKLQAEYLQRRERGQLSLDSVLAGPIAGELHSSQSAWYGQAVYQFVSKWRVGVRYDRLNSGSMQNALVSEAGMSQDDFPILQAYQPKRTSLMLDYSPSEFSRFRLQYARDQASPEGQDNQIFLQYLMSLGAHTAHQY